MCLDTTIKSCNLVLLSHTWSSHLSLCLHAHSCSRMLDFGVRNALGNFGASLGKYVCWVGLSWTSCCWEGFDDEKMRVCLLGYSEACVLSWAFCSTEGMWPLGRMWVFFLLKANGVLNGTFDISSCLTLGRKCSSRKTVQTLCAVSAALQSSVNDE